MHKKQDGETLARSCNECSFRDRAQDEMVKSRRSEPTKGMHVTVSSDDVHGEASKGMEEVHRFAVVSTDLLHEQIDLDVVSETILSGATGAKPFLEPRPPALKLPAARRGGLMVSRRALCFWTLTVSKTESATITL